MIYVIVFFFLSHISFKKSFGNIYCNDNGTAYNCIQVEKDSGKTAEY